SVHQFLEKATPVPIPPSAALLNLPNIQQALAIESHSTILGWRPIRIVLTLMRSEEFSDNRQPFSFPFISLAASYAELSCELHLAGFVLLSAGVDSAVSKKTPPRADENPRGWCVSTRACLGNAGRG